MYSASSDGVNYKCVNKYKEFGGDSMFTFKSKHKAQTIELKGAVEAVTLDLMYNEAILLTDDYCNVEKKQKLYC